MTTRLIDLNIPGFAIVVVRLAKLAPPSTLLDVSRPADLPLLRRLSGVITVATFAFLYLPIVLLLVYSFNKSRLNVVWTGFTFDWYVQLWRDRPLMTALQNSLIVAAFSTVLSVLLGTAGAWLLHRYRFPLGRTLLGLVYVPIVIPDVIMGISLLILFSFLATHAAEWPILASHHIRPGLGFTTVILAHITFCFPFVLVAVRARLVGLDPSLEEAAMDLGAPPLRAFVSVILPQLMPAIISGAMLAFTLSMDELIVTFFTTGPNSVTLPIKIFGMAKVGLNPMLNAVSAVFIFVTAMLIGIGELLQPRGAAKLSG